MSKNNGSQALSVNDFGRFIKSLRNKRRLTLAKLGEEIGYSNSYLSQIESGKKGIPSPELLKKMSAALDVPYETLMSAAGYIENTSEDGFADISGRIDKNKEELKKKQKKLAKIDSMLTDISIQKMNLMLEMSQFENNIILELMNLNRLFHRNKRMLDGIDFTFNIDDIEVTRNGEKVNDDEKKSILNYIFKRM